MWLVGVDEAGRGPCLGPLVVAALAIPAKDSPHLDEIGVDDSKNLTAEKRQSIAEAIESLAKEKGWKISILEANAAQIDDWMASKNLNELEVEMFASVISKCTDGGDCKLILDACDVNAERFGNNVSTRLPGWPWDECEVDSRHKADETDKVVGAASIIAKVRRDSRIDEIAERLGFDCGSGYPSDPNTQAALPRLMDGDLPDDDLRWCWQTTKDAWSEISPGEPLIRSEVKPLFSTTSLLDYL